MSINAKDPEQPRDHPFRSPAMSLRPSETAKRFVSPPPVCVNKQGRLEIPAELVTAVGGKPGESLVARVTDGVLTVETVDNALKRIRASLRRYVPEGVSLVDELIAERRAEAARE